MPEGEHRWLPAEDLIRMAGCAGFDLVEFVGRILCPKEIPLLARPLNRAASLLPLLRPLCLIQALVFSPR
jgi:hypothetical protein